MLGKEAVRDLEALYFAHAQPSAEHEQHERPITRRADDLQEPTELLVRQVARQRLGWAEVVPPRVHRIPRRGIRKLTGSLSVKFKPHPQCYEPAVDRRSGSSQSLLPDDELIDVGPLRLTNRPAPPGKEDIDVTDVMDGGGRTWKPTIQISREGGDSIDHLGTPGGRLSPTLHQGLRNLM
jgi:hypothetical protein